MDYSARRGGVDFVCPSIRDYLSECETRGILDAVHRSLTISTKLGILNCDLNASVSRDCTVSYDLDRILDYTEAMIQWIGSLHWSIPIRSLHINLKLTPLRKVWCPQAGVVNLLGKCEVNSGETYFPNADRRHITVWRAEDWSKVLLHELLHAFGWDRLVPASPDNQSEAVVEAMATLLHCQILGGPSGWQSVLESELEWMRRQVTTLQAHRWQADQTSVRSYYVVKAALLANIKLFAQWLRQPTQQLLRQSWPELARQTTNALLSTIVPANPSNSCISMRMVQAQLSLAPLPISS